ncbi:postreplication repair E3 ubiquitin-protein ligase Rad18p [[Candida] railenensis]|uniref:Postreplication repair E3 ubiquitin-protein ligase RAD18 n=1 Tax=[Candida] railenensis TaxID=45579 RepID=A0A9P0VXP2_9ASCO|nr:postreplication repair E3 ubiquitin-protein ligase Rad18p [[Candida] railenensis]
MSSNPFAKNLENVTDPTDWNSSQIPDLTDLDSLLRCFICKEFLRAPVMTGCNHTFCSQCIREYLITNSHCPLCDSEQYESNLKRVIQLEEVVLCYSKVRSTLLSCLKLPEEVAQKRQENSAKAVQDEIIEIGSDDEEGNNLNERSITKDVETICEQETATPVVEKEQEETPRKKRKTAIGTQLTSMDSIPTRDQLVECPICSKIMSAEILQTNHIDNCLSRSPSDSPKPSGSAGISSFFQPKVSSSTSASNLSSSSSNDSNNFGSSYKKKSNQDFYFKEASKHHNDIKKLPKLDFSSLTTPRLKDKLVNLKLPTQGTRIQLELRYNQYYILFNSNLDSSHPVSEKVLKQKLNQWELSHSSFSSNQVNSKNSLFDFGGSNPTLKNITDKNFSVSEWLNAYKGEFARLTRLAKKSMKEKVAEENPNKEDPALENEGKGDIDMVGTSGEDHDTKESVDIPVKENEENILVGNQEEQHKVITT